MDRGSATTPDRAIEALQRVAPDADDHLAGQLLRDGSLRRQRLPAADALAAGIREITLRVVADSFVQKFRTHAGHSPLSPGASLR
jgi:hypothetical protein